MLHMDASTQADKQDTILVINSAGEGEAFSGDATLIHGNLLWHIDESQELRTQLQCTSSIALSSIVMSHLAPVFRWRTLIRTFLLKLNDDEATGWNQTAVRIRLHALRRHLGAVRCKSVDGNDFLP